MHHLVEEPIWAAKRPQPLDALLPAAIGMSLLCLLLFGVLLVL